MFKIVNEIAYHGQMINCTPERSEFPFPPSNWVDVPNAPSNGNWIPTEGEHLDELLQEIHQPQAIQQPQQDFSQVFLITPFRAVARRRLYVIGDQNAWSKLSYFKTLATELNPPPD